MTTLLTGWLTVLVTTLLVAGGETSPPSAETSAAGALPQACDALVFGLPEAERDYGCYNRASFRAPEETLEHLEALLEAHPEDGRLWLTFGSVAGDQGRDAAPAFRTAIAKLDAADRPRYQIQAQLNLARLLVRRDDRSAALAVLGAAEQEADALGHPLLAAVVEFERLGMLALSLDGDVLAALDHASETYDALGDETPYQVRRNGAAVIARGYRALGLPEVAARWSDRARAVAQQAGDHAAALRAERGMSRARWRADKKRHAVGADARYRQRIDALLPRAIAQDNPWAELMLRTDAAEAAEPGDARQRWEAVLSMSTEMEAAAKEERARGELAMLDAADTPQRAAERVEALLAAKTEGDATRGVLLRNVAGRIALVRRDFGRMWSAWDAMLKILDQGERAQGDEGRALLRARDLERYRMVAGSLLRHTPPVLRWNRRAFDVMERMRGRELAEFSRSAAINPGNPGTRASLDEVRAALAPSQALLMFQVGRESEDASAVFGGSWLLVVTRAEVRRYALPSARLLDPAVAMAAASFAREASGSGDVARAALYETLLEQPLADLPAEVRDLVMVLDGELHRVPLAALGPQGGPPVLTRFSVSTSSSATAWLRGRAATPLQRDVLVLADPHLGSAATDSLPPLPGARAESRFLSALFGSQARVLLGADATEAALVQAPPSGVLHIAAHAVVDRLQPDRSRVALAPGDGQDGDVTLRELSVVPLESTVVVLGACHGADGELLAGEGPLSAARAFSAAGATAVVASLWPVQDREAAAFFAEMYRALDDGVPVAEAVARAQSRRRSAGAPLRDWAGFVVYGDSAVRLEAPQRSLGWLWVLLAAASGGGLAWILLGHRRARERRHQSTAQRPQPTEHAQGHPGSDRV